MNREWHLNKADELLHGVDDSASTWKEHRMDRVLNADVGPPPSEDELASDRNE